MYAKSSARSRPCVKKQDLRLWIRSWSYAKDNDKVMDVMKAHQDEIKGEVLADQIILGEVQGYTKEWNINKEQVTLAVVKVQED